MDVIDDWLQRGDNAEQRNRLLHSVQRYLLVEQELELDSFRKIFEYIRGSFTSIFG